MPFDSYRPANNYSPSHREQWAQGKADKLAAEVAQADRRAQLDADLEARGKAPWWRRMFRRKPPLPYQ